MVTEDLQEIRPDFTALELAANGVDGRPPVIPEADREALQRWRFEEWELAAYDSDFWEDLVREVDFVATYPRLFRHLWALTRRLEAPLVPSEGQR